MPDIAIIIRYILEFINTLYKEYKQNERQKAIQKVKDQPANSWNDKWGNGTNGLPDDEWDK